MDEHHACLLASLKKRNMKPFDTKKKFFSTMLHRGKNGRIVFIADRGGKKEGTTSTKGGRYPEKKKREESDKTHPFAGAAQQKGGVRRFLIKGEVRVFWKKGGDAIHLQLKGGTS